MTGLSKEADIPAEAFTQLGETRASHQEKTLNVQEVKISCYTAEELNSFITNVRSTEPDTVIFKKNELGKLAIEPWALLCNGLRASPVKTLVMDNNLLNLFSLEHWTTFEVLIKRMPFLSSLSLQHNNLAALDEASYMVLAKIGRHLIQTNKGACKVSKNNWSHERFSDFIDKTHAFKPFTLFNPLREPQENPQQKESPLSINNRI